MKQNILSWQKHIAHVSQDVFILDSSFIENIAFGIALTDIDMQRVKLSARMANIDDVIENMDGGYHAMVGERGARLSGGQRQRIGIARALYANTDILVLDESTSALDLETESKILSSIHDIMKEITVIVIAHRFTVIKDCDRIYRVEQGRIISEGDPNKIFANKIDTIE